MDKEWRLGGLEAWRRSGSEWSRWNTEVKLFSPLVLYGSSDLIIRHGRMLNVDFLNIFWKGNDKAMSIMNSFVNDLFSRIAVVASKLVHYKKRYTITNREIQTAVRLLLPGELVKHDVSEGTKAVTNYTSSK